MTEKPKGLLADFIREVCWSGTDGSQRCRYLRAYRGVWICAKGTAAGIRHSKRIDDLVKRRKEDDGEVVFDSGSDLVPQEISSVSTIHAGDNCPGRAHEFPDQFPKDEVS